MDKRGINTFEVEVTDLNHLNKVMNNIMKLAGVTRVERLKG
ncbi:MAG TPA: ACT domain-containing protein [Geobacteraceae bacterium]|nr:ACT domain-containing protein [Geobacteraceae bacterium]